MWNFVRSRQLAELGPHDVPAVPNRRRQNQHGESPLACARVGVERRPLDAAPHGFDSSKGHTQRQLKGCNYAFTSLARRGGGKAFTYGGEGRQAALEWMQRIGRRMSC